MPQALTGLGRRRRLRGRGPLGRLLCRGARHAVRPCRWREVNTLSGGEQKRLVLEALLRGPDQVLLLDEPDNYLDVPGKLWLEDRLRETAKTVLLVSHDRELLASAAERIVTVESRRRVGPRRRVRDVRPGPQRPQRPARRAAPPLGRGTREAQTAGAHATAEGGLQRRHGLAATRPRRPGCASSRRPARPSWRRGTRTSGCGCAAAAPASAR